MCGAVSGLFLCLFIEGKIWTNASQPFGGVKTLTLTKVSKP